MRTANPRFFLAIKIFIASSCPDYWLDWADSDFRRAEPALAAEVRRVRPRRRAAPSPASFATARCRCGWRRIPARRCRRRRSRRAPDAPAPSGEWCWSGCRPSPCSIPHCSDCWCPPFDAEGLDVPRQHERKFFLVLLLFRVLYENGALPQDQIFLAVLARRERKGDAP